MKLAGLIYLTHRNSCISKYSAVCLSKNVEEWRKQLALVHRSSKNDACKHIIGMSVKRKRGRPPKAKIALLPQ